MLAVELVLNQNLIKRLNEQIPLLALADGAISHPSPRVQPSQLQKLRVQ